MLKVLHVNDYPPTAGGGAELLLARTVELLRARSTQVDIFTSADLPDSRRTLRRYLDNPIARAALCRRLDELRPDVVHLHNFYHILSPGILLELERYRRERPLRVVMTAHDYHLVCPNSGGNWFRSRTRRPVRAIDPARVGSLGYLLSRRWDQRGRLYSLLKTLQHVWNYRCRGARRALDVVICPSRFVQALVDRLGQPTTWLPHPAPQLRASSLRPGSLRLVFAGRLGPEKGVAEFLQHFPTIGATLTIIGDGPELPRCRAIAAARGLDVVFQGWRPHAETMAEIARAHVLVLPSRCLESYGLTLIEALAAGTNVLASDLGAMRETVESAGVGFLFDPADPASLADQLWNIESEHRAGTLNRFDVAAFLAARSEDRYIAGLTRLYEGAAA